MAARYLTRHPILLDELLDARTLLAPPDWPSFTAELEQQLESQRGDTELMMDTLREAHHAQLFRFLAQDLAGGLTVERLADHLSKLADIIVETALKEVWLAMPKRPPGNSQLRHHRLRETGWERAGVCVRPRSDLPVRR